MTRRAAWMLTFAAGLIGLVPGSFAQILLQPTPPPAVTAENEPWYVSGEPISLNGRVYYPSGPITHFNRIDMIESGFFDRIPIYTKPTQEPGSMIYVPLAGGLVRPYERRRSGELAGTVGSTVPSFPVISPAEQANPSAAPAPEFVQVPAITPPPQPVGTAGYLFATTGSTASLPEPVGTAGPEIALSSLPVRSGPTRVESLRRPVGLNNVFIEFRGSRWFAAGPAVVFSGDRFIRIGERAGFPVYQEPGRPTVIYVPLTPGSPSLVAPYKSR